MVPDPTYLETVLTCEGDFYAPNFSNYFVLLQRQLARLIADDRSTLIVKKVEPWNSVRVTLKIPPEAANRLRELAIEQTAMLRNLGILAVHIEGDNVISMSLKGHDERDGLLSNIQNNANGVCPDFSRSSNNVLLTGNKNENPPSPSPSEMNIIEKASNVSGEQLTIGPNSQKTCPRKSSSLAGRKRQHESQGCSVTDEGSLLQTSACSVNQSNHNVLQADDVHDSAAADLSMSGGALPNGYHLGLPGQSFQSNGKRLPVVRPKDFKAGISNMDDLTRLNGCLSFCKLQAPMTALTNSFKAGLSAESSMSVSLICQSSTTSSSNLGTASHLAKCDRINHSPSNPLIPSSCTDTIVCTKSKGLAYKKDTGGKASKSVNLGTASDNSQIHSKQRLHSIINPYSGEFELVPEDENLVTKDYSKITDSSKMPYESLSFESHNRSMLYETAIKTSVADSNALPDNNMSSTAAALTDDSVLQAIVAQLCQPFAASRDQDENRILSDADAIASGRLSSLAENWSQLVTNLPVHAKSHLPINSNAILIASDALQGALGGLVMNASLLPTRVTLPAHVSRVDSSVPSTNCSAAVDSFRTSARNCTRQSNTCQPCLSMQVSASGATAASFCSGRRPLFQGSDSGAAGLDESVEFCSSLVSSSEQKPVESVLPSVQQVDRVMNPLWVPGLHCLARPEFLDHFVGQNYASNKIRAGFSMASASPFLSGMRMSASNGSDSVGTMKNQCVAVVPEDKPLQKDGVRASTGKQSKSRKQLKTSTAIRAHGITIHSENLPHGKQSKPPTVAELLANRTRQAATCLVPAQVASSTFSVLPSFAACPVKASSISMSNIALLNLMPYQQSSADVWCSTTSSFPPSSNSSVEIAGTSSGTDSTKTAPMEVGFESDLSVTRTCSDAQLSSAFPLKQNGRPDDSMAIGLTATDFNGKGAETEKSASIDLLTIENSSSNVSYSSALNISEVGDVDRKEQSS